MKTYSHKRDSSDEEWKKTKMMVNQRDGGQCRLMKCLTLSEMIILRKNAGSFIQICDPAHIKSVSSSPEIMYDYNNIVTLNRYSHTNLDDYRSPIDGHHISKEEAERWWIRIAKTNYKQYQYLIDNKILPKGE